MGESSLAAIYLALARRDPGAFAICAPKPGRLCFTRLAQPRSVAEDQPKRGAPTGGETDLGPALCIKRTRLFIQ
jgi:hypothetical protein